MKRIISWNVNGLRAAEKKGIKDWLINYSPDILCLQETKAQKEQLSLNIKNIEGYNSYYVSAQKKGYSGVAIYSKEEPLIIEEGLGNEAFDMEGRTIIVKYKDYTLYNIYFPNGNASDERLEYKMNFYNVFLDKVIKGSSEGERIIICGDINTAHKEIDLKRPKENMNNSGFLKIEREWIDKFIDSGFIDTFRMFNKEKDNYSWWDYKTRARDRNVGWRLDYFFINKILKENIKDAFILSEVKGSDHCPIGIDIEVG